VKRCLLLAACWLSAAPLPAADASYESPPKPGTLHINKERGEVVLAAVVRHPRGKPCIDDWGQRIQAFAGCSKAAGGEAKMLGYFVFVADLPTEDVYQALVDLGAKTKVHYSMEEGHRRSGLKPGTRIKGRNDPVYGVAVTPDGKLLAAAGDDRTVRLYEVPGGRERGRFAGHADAVFAVTFFPDGRTAASAGADGTIQIWAVPKPSPAPASGGRQSPGAAKKPGD
jgi:WD40 repeat protein